MLSDSIKLLVAGFVMGWVVFSIGRLLALAILGGLATVAFGRINQFFPPQRSGWLYAIAALFMVVMGGLIIVGKGLRIPIGNRVLERGTESIFLFGFLMGVAPCVPYVAILTYIACIAENAVLDGVMYGAVFAVGTAIAPTVLGTLVGIIPGTLLKSAKVLRTFQVVCGFVLILFGFQLFYYVLKLVR